jgi:hypothetical protein
MEEKTKMAKKKLSAYNKHMKSEMAKGKSFKEAAHSWKPKKKG